MNIGMISHAVGAACLFILFLLLLTSWRGRLQGALLVVAVFVNLVWAIVSAYHWGAAFNEWALPYRVLEAARQLAWIAFLSQLLTPLIVSHSSTVKTFRYLFLGLLGCGGLLLTASLFPRQSGILNPGAELMLFGHISLAVGGLALIEQLFRNTRPRKRWATKFLYLGLGALFAYDFFLYADALLFKRIDSSIWYARGLINAMVVPLIAVSAARNPQWSLEVFVSRRMVTHSVSVIGAGLYLLSMAGVGYYIRLYGGTWGSAVQMAFLCGAGLLLLALLFSGQLRAHVKVFLTKHFFIYKYDYRDEWLKFIGTLSAEEPGQPLRQRPIHALAAIVDSPAGILWTRAENGSYRLAGTWNTSQQGPRIEPGDSSLIEFLERRQWVIEVDECETEPELYDPLTLPAWLRAMRRWAWIVVPLMQGTQLQGFIVLERPRVRRTINWEDRDLLKTAGRQVAGYVALLDTTDALMDADQFQAFNRLSAYVVHDLKNIAAQLSLVVSNAARHKHNPAFVDDAIRTVENATAKMNQMLAQLRKGGTPANEAVLFSLSEALQEVNIARSIRKPAPTLIQSDPALTLRASRTGFTAVLEHLIQNAQEAAGPEGNVQVKCYRDGLTAVIEIHDNGCGMDERFVHERLFRPFNTTKGNAGMGIGVYESREFIHAMGGEIDVVSQSGKGTTFFLHLPLAEAEAVDRDVKQRARWPVARID